jgi:predicted nucleotidyltransferase
MDTLIPRIKSVLTKFAIEQEVLLLQDVHEEAITGSLLGYLEDEFSDLDFDIDTQYNRRVLENELINKQAEFLIEKLPLEQWPMNWDDNQKSIKKSILPDFIFHDRNGSNSNFLIIELKKSSNQNEADRLWDEIKLREMTRRDLHYDYGLFIDIKTGTDYSVGSYFNLTLYEDGEIILQE